MQFKEFTINFHTHTDVNSKKFTINSHTHTDGNSKKFTINSHTHTYAIHIHTEAKIHV